MILYLISWSLKVWIALLFVWSSFIILKGTRQLIIRVVFLSIYWLKTRVLQGSIKSPFLFIYDSFDPSAYQWPNCIYHFSNENISPLVLQKKTKGEGAHMLLLWALLVVPSTACYTSWMFMYCKKSKPWMFVETAKVTFLRWFRNGIKVYFVRKRSYIDVWFRRV